MPVGRKFEMKRKPKQNQAVLMMNAQKTIR